ncbi:MAG: hypothetical protein NT030_08400 [Candidatus Saganbacteria bacterium]|nr:hypothetical protein [Candidatus Saganbacteria bacterium]
MDGIGTVIAKNNITTNTAKSNGSAEGSGASFLESVAAAIERGEIVVAGKDNTKEVDFLKRKFDFRTKVPKKEEGIHDFLAKIEKIIKKKGRS